MNMPFLCIDTISGIVGPAPGRGRPLVAVEARATRPLSHMKAVQRAALPQHLQA